MTPRERGGGRAGRVAEPVQVYLKDPDRERLARLVDRLGASKSDVLRRALQALEAQLAPTIPANTVRALPTFAGDGLLPGVALGSGAALRDAMDAEDDAAAR